MVDRPVAESRMSFDPASPVLVIEPDLLALKKIKQALVRVDVMSIDNTATAAKGMAMVKQKPYGLIICEYFLSPINGFDSTNLLDSASSNEDRSNFEESNSSRSSETTSTFLSPRSIDISRS